MRSRPEICRATAQALRARRQEIAEIPAFVGFDGFVDEICTVVDQRDGGRVQAVPTIARLAQKIASAAGRSGNYELAVKESRAGGNGPIMAGALAALGMQVSCIGAVGWPEMHPVFAELAKRADVRGIAPPAHTDALEFADGKLMLGKLEALNEVTWENLVRRVGAGELEAVLERSRLISMVNWTMIPQMSRIWAKLIDAVLPTLAAEPVPGTRPMRRAILIDLADPEKRTRDDLFYALRLLGRIQPFADVTLGLNLKEAQQVCAALDLPAPPDDGMAIAESAQQIRQALQITCCVIHPRTGATAATGNAATSVEGPFVHEPAISTGAGDHFNAGFMLGRLLDLPLEECLCAGVATSGYYVRRRRSPSVADLAEFIEDLPQPEGV